MAVPAPTDVVQIPAWEPFCRIGTIANRSVLQVSPWLTARAAAAVLREASADKALVVDGDGTPLGVVNCGRLEKSEPMTSTGALLTPLAAVLHESVPVSVAASLMAASLGNRIAVVSDGRRACGVLNAADLLLWQASQTRPGEDV